MRILYLSQYFPPEVGATQTRSFEMARFLVKKGHEVTVVTEIPNHPSGIIHPDFRHTYYKRKFLCGIEVIYVPCLVFKRKNFWTRMLFYLSYMVSATVTGFVVCRSDYDLIYATSPPLPVGIAALMLHWGKRIPMFFEVRDLWPASATALGELSGRHSIRIASLIEKTCYAAALKIIVVTRGIQSVLQSRGVSSDKIELIPTGTTVETFRRSPEAGAALRKELGIEGKFVILYAGVLGIAQGLEFLLEAFSRLPDEMRCQLIIVGEGPTATSLKQQVRVRGLGERIRFLGERTREKMPALYSAAEAALVPLRRIDLFKGARPLKMFDAWSCETPVLLGIEGEAAEILANAGGGLLYRPEDSLDLARAIKELYHAGEAARRRMGREAREYVLNYHSTLRNARRLEWVISHYGSRNSDR